jgi:hypothetical protein
MLFRECAFFALFNREGSVDGGNEDFVDEAGGTFRRAAWHCPATAGETRLTHLWDIERKLPRRQAHYNNLHDTLKTDIWTSSPPRVAEFSDRLPSMESESDHEHRDDESASEQEEIEETKPKPALKKAREPVAPVVRPELPYVSENAAKMPQC